MRCGLLNSTPYELVLEPSATLSPQWRSSWASLSVRGRFITIVHSHRNSQTPGLRLPKTGMREPAAVRRISFRFFGTSDGKRLWAVGDKGTILEGRGSVVVALFPNTAYLGTRSKSLPAASFPTLAAKGAARMGHPRWGGADRESKVCHSLRGIRVLRNRSRRVRRDHFWAAI